MPGVFAAGDVRHGSIKRVASAVGEGAMAGLRASLSRYGLVPRFAQVHGRNDDAVARRISARARRLDAAQLLRQIRADRHSHPHGADRHLHRLRRVEPRTQDLQCIASRTFDPTDYSVFQAVFGAIFTVIIALEFKRSLLVVAQRQQSIVQVRTVVLIALLAIVRKVMILDLASTEALQLFALAAAIIALGAVYWLVRDQDRSIERDQSAQHRKLRRQSSARVKADSLHGVTRCPPCP